MEIKTKFSLGDVVFTIINSCVVTFQICEIVITSDDIYYGNIFEEYVTQDSCFRRKSLANRFLLRRGY